MSRGFRLPAASAAVVCCGVLAPALVACEETNVPPVTVAVVAPPVTPPAPPPAPPPVVAPPPAPPPPPSDHVADELLEQHRHHHHGGVTMFIAMGIDTLAVSATERPKVDAIQDLLSQSMAPAQDAERKVVVLLADAVQAGVVNPQAVDAAIAQLATAAGARQVATVAALKKLHAALTPVERATLVDKVQAHWAVWGHANGAAAGATQADEGRLAELTELLGLTSEQLDKVKTTLAATAAGAQPLDFKDVDGHLHAFEAAFTAPVFDPKTLGLGSTADARLAAVGATRMARFCEAAVPVLTPEQRLKLAAHLREHLDHSDTPTGT